MNALILALLAVGGLVLAGTIQTGSDFVDGLKFQVNLLNIPSISHGKLEFHITASIINPSNVTMPLDSVFASIYKKEGNGWKYLGSSQPDLTDIKIRPHATSKINFNIKVPLLAGATELIDVFKNLLTNKAIAGTYKVETKIGIEGRTITQNFETTI